MRAPSVDQPLDPGAVEFTPLSERRWLPITVTGKLPPSAWFTTARSTSGGRSLSRLVEASGAVNSVSLPNCVTSSTATRLAAPTLRLLTW